MASTYLHRTPSSSGSVTTATMSAWVKRSATGEANQIFGGQTGVDGNNRTKFGIETDDTMACQLYNSGSSYDWKSTRKLRDCNGWYNLVFVFDTTNGTAGDRIRFYCNGERITSFGTQTAIPLNAELKMNTTSDSIYVGARKTSSTVNQFFNGCMSHVHFIDGTAYEASTFGSTDATTGEWKIKTSPTVTMGTNGFTILKDGNTITDQSTNSNNFTLGAGTLTNTEDCPSDVFATMNPLIPDTTAYVYSNANNTVAQSGGTSYWVKTCSTLGMSKGKYYWEAKYVSGLYTVIGVCSTTSASAASGMPPDGIGYKRNGEVHISQSSVANISTYTTGDIISCYLDMDNEALYYAKNGVMENSGVPTSGASKTGGFALPVSGVPYFASISPYDSSGGATSMNFGNGYFGTTAISSEGTNASGIGKFEYDVPTGYTALSTKGLNN